VVSSSQQFWAGKRMKTIDIIYRFSPDEGAESPHPEDANAARALLEEGNKMFANWTLSCVDDSLPQSSYTIVRHPRELGLPTPDGKVAAQAPFAVVIGCSDARVPAEMIFGQLRNDLFVVRLAGNVLSEESIGSVTYAVHNLKESIRIVVVLGHTGCGAVAAAVDTYLNPWDYLSKASSGSLRAIVDRIFVPVRKAANTLEILWGSSAAEQPGYRDALIELAVFLNAAQAAYNLRLEMLEIKRPDVHVVYGVFDLLTQQIWTVPVSKLKNAPSPSDVRLADAPSSLSQFEELTLRMGLRIARKYSPSTKSLPPV
jgi:carbonic anhydrase